MTIFNAIKNATSSVSIWHEAEPIYETRSSQSCGTKLAHGMPILKEAKAEYAKLQ
jgi:hypothetical protein